MSNNSADATEQDSNGAASITVQGLTAGQVGIYVIQGFAIFVAFTTLLGRIYLQAYSSALRIPESEFQIDDVLSYALVSPDMAISGVGVALVSVFAVIALTRRIRPIQRRWPTFLAGLGLLVVNLLMLRVYSGNGGIPESGIGAHGIWWLSYSASMTLGTALALSALVSWYTAQRANGRSHDNWIVKAIRTFMPAIFYAVGIGTIVLMLIITILQATAVGRMDASVQLRDAPLVELTSKSQTLSGILMGGETNLDIDQLAYSFKLVHVGHRFAYIRPPEFSRILPEDAGLNSGGPYQYAIPVTEIASITQIVDPE